MRTRAKSSRRVSFILSVVFRSHGGEYFEETPTYADIPEGSGMLVAHDQAQGKRSRMEDKDPLWVSSSFFLHSIPTEMFNLFHEIHWEDC